MPECHSTNSLALELSQQSFISDGTLIITDHQTTGRGQRGNTWEAQQGKNLTFSVFLKPAFLSVKDQFFLNIFTSLAIHDLLKDITNATVQIKWPNDVLINDKKVCGILIENQIRGLQVSTTIAGIGLNVNQTHFSVPTATSVSNVMNQELILEEVLNSLISFLEARYLQLRKGDYNGLKQEYLKQLYWYQELRVFAAGKNTFKGTITGIDENGRLVISTQHGNRFFNVKEVTYVE